jgi:hypothetical protein
MHIAGSKLRHPRVYCALHNQRLYFLDDQPLSLKYLCLEQDIPALEGFPRMLLYVVGSGRDNFVRYTGLDTLQTTRHNNFAHGCRLDDLDTWPTSVQFHSPNLAVP